MTPPTSVDAAAPATRAAIYTRISEADENDHKAHERQIHQCRALAAKLGVEVVEIYTDHDVSISKPGASRPGHRGLCEAIRRREIDVVLTWDIDRMYRTTRELEDYIELCEPLTVMTHSVEAGLIDLSTPNGQLVARIGVAVAQHESAHKARRIKVAYDQAIRQGRWTGGKRPFGWRADDPMKIHPVEGPALALAIRQVLDGRSINSICRQWNGEGLLTSGGTQWTGATMTQVLMRPRNGGLRGKRGDRPSPDDVLPGVEPIVNPLTWLELQSMMSNPSRRTTARTWSKLFGSGLYRCWCGVPVSAGSTRHGHRTYACGRDKRHVHRRAAPIDAYVDRAVRRELAKLGEHRRTLPTPEAPSSPVTTWRERIEQLQAFGRRDHGLMNDGLMTEAEYRAARIAYRDEIADLEDRISRARPNLFVAGVFEANDPLAAFDALGPDKDDLRRKVVQALVTITLAQFPEGVKKSAPFEKVADHVVKIEPIWMSHWA